jgi:hypothetical protein
VLEAAARMDSPFDSIRHLYYRMVTGEEAPLMFKFSLTADGKVLYYHDLPHDY